MDEQRLTEKTKSAILFSRGLVSHESPTKTETKSPHQDLNDLQKWEIKHVQIWADLNILGTKNLGKRKKIQEYITKENESIGFWVSKPLQNLDLRSIDEEFRIFQEPNLSSFQSSSNCGNFLENARLWAKRSDSKEFLPLHQPFTWCGELSGFRFFLFFLFHYKTFFFVS